MTSYRTLWHGRILQGIDLENESDSDSLAERPSAMLLDQVSTFHPEAASSACFGPERGRMLARGPGSRAHKLPKIRVFGALNVPQFVTAK